MIRGEMTVHVRPEVVRETIPPDGGLEPLLAPRHKPEMFADEPGLHITSLEPPLGPLPRGQLPNTISTPTSTLQYPHSAPSLQ